MTSASLLIVLFVGTVVGAVVGMIVGLGYGEIALAIVAGFLGSIAAVMIRNLIINKGVGVGADDAKTPVLMAIYAVVASLAGSLAAKEVADFAEIDAPGGIGALAGLFSALLLAMLLITCHTNPGEAPKLKKKR